VILTEEQRAIAALARDLATGEIAPHVAAWDRAHTFPRATIATLGASGLLGLLVPEEYGGSAAGYLSYALTIEEIARVDAGTATTLSVHAMVSNAIAKLGDAGQRERWLPALATGETLGAFALTEPDAGSDAAAIRGRAERAGDGYVLDGRKQWCTNGGYAGVVMTMFRTGGSGAKGITAFLVDTALAGVDVERVTEKLGIHTSNTVDLAFTAVRVPAGARLGEEGSGFSSALSTLAAGRIGIAAQAVGILAACLDASVKFARERVAFGLERRAPARGRSGADPRRVRLYDRVSGRALLPRCEDHRDLRRHLRDPAGDHRARSRRPLGRGALSRCCGD
jgi:hypothetical protein